jgi:hypothetical protein
MSASERYFVKAFDEETKSLRVNSFSSLLNGIEFNKIEATYPTTSTELYQYLLSGDVKAQILVTYTNSSKEVFVSAERL